MTTPAVMDAALDSVARRAWVDVVPTGVPTGP